jgi:hypothetical protein
MDGNYPNTAFKNRWVTPITYKGTLVVDQSSLPMTHHPSHYVRNGLDTAEFERVQESPGDAAPRSSLRPSRGRFNIHKRSDFENVLYQSA